jgi:hypothetical protein
MQRIDTTLIGRDHEETTQAHLTDCARTRAPKRKHDATTVISSAAAPSGEAVSRRVRHRWQEDDAIEQRLESAHDLPVGGGCYETPNVWRLVIRSMVDAVDAREGSHSDSQSHMARLRVARRLVVLGSTCRALYRDIANLGVRLVLVLGIREDSTTHLLFSSLEMGSPDTADHPIAIDARVGSGHHMSCLTRCEARLGLLCDGSAVKGPRVDDASTMDSRDDGDEEDDSDGEDEDHGDDSRDVLLSLTLPEYADMWSMIDWIKEDNDDINDEANDDDDNTDDEYDDLHDGQEGLIVDTDGDGTEWTFTVLNRHCKGLKLRRIEIIK